MLCFSSKGDGQDIFYTFGFPPWLPLMNRSLDTASQVQYVGGDKKDACDANHKAPDVVGYKNKLIQLALAVSIAHSMGKEPMAFVQGEA